jgi:hypothetical protein
MPNQKVWIGVLALMFGGPPVEAEMTDRKGKIERVTIYRTDD